jgi:transmembrane sensor
MMREQPQLTVLPQTNRARSSAHPFAWRGWLAAGVAVLAVGIGVMAWVNRASDHYATALGEQRMVKLEDGSIVHLNTRSRISVHFLDSQREVRLEQGEALFQVERDPARPFIVRSGSTTVRAVGTAFNVYRRGSEVQVTVVEGRAQVSAMPRARTTARDNTPAATLPTLLAAGEAAVVAEDHISKTTAGAVSRAVAWRERRLVFKDTPLGEVASEFNRYNKSQMRIEGEALQARAITGVFSADHPQSLILYLSEFGSLQVSPEGEDWVVRAR